jgi:hypothetical protein
LPDELLPQFVELIRSNADKATAHL